MNLLMAAAPLAMQMCGHAYGFQVLVIEWHIVAMFAPAFFTGWLISRIGVLPIMFAGVLVSVFLVRGRDLQHQEVGVVEPVLEPAA